MVWLVVAAYGVLCVLPASGRQVTISNVKSRFDVDGNFVNAHDGGIYLFNNLYYMYGTVYEHCHQAAPTCDGVCGYYNNTFSLYTSPDLVTWTLITTNILPGIVKDHATVSYWMANVGYNQQTGIYVMNYWDGKYGFRDSQVGMAISKDPEGPFQIVTPITLKGAAVISSTTNLFIDSKNNAWLRYNTRDAPLRHVVELLTPDWLNTTGQFATIYIKNDYPWYEGGGMFERNGLYYIILGTDCCFCQWGANAKVFTATNPLGNWTYQNDINHCADGTLAPDHYSNGTQNPCSLNDPYGTNFTIDSQQFNVVSVKTKTDTVYLYYGELFRSAADGWKSEDRQAWIPLQFANISILPMQWLDQFTLDLPDLMLTHEQTSEMIERKETILLH